MKEKIFRIFCGLVAAESFIITISLLYSKSLEENAGIFGYSFYRLFLIGIFLSTFLVAVAFSYLFMHDRRFHGIYSNLINRILEKEAINTFILDFFCVLFLVSIGILFFYSYSPRFLSFLWNQLPGFIDREILVLIFVIVFCFQTIILILVIRPDTIRKIVTNWKSSFKKASIFLMISTIAYLGYLITARSVGNTYFPYPFFPDLAEAFLEGKLYLDPPPKNKEDLTFYNGRYYVSFPPGPALLFLPEVATSSKYSVDPIRFNHFSAALGVGFIFLILEALNSRGWAKLKLKQTFLLTILFGFGTAQYFMATNGHVWFTSQILSATCASLSLLLVLSNKSTSMYSLYRSALFSGLSLGWAVLTRPHLGFASLMILGIIYQHMREHQIYSHKRLLTWLVIFSVPLLGVISGLFWYNFIRFGSVLDFGYKYMLVGHLEPLLSKYGQFNLHFIPINLKANLFGLPSWNAQCNFLTPNRSGMSIFITTPAVLLLIGKYRKKIWIIGAWIVIAIIAFLHLLYFNTGGGQFGYRFSLDFLPMAFCLLANRLTEYQLKWLPYLVSWSLIINFLGVIWYAEKLCAN